MRSIIHREVKFDLIAFLPTSTAIQNATLQMVPIKMPPKATIWLLAVGGEWSEAETTDLNAPPIIMVPVGAMDVPRHSNQQSLDGDVTDIVRRWVANPSENNGLALKAEEGETVIFATKENVPRTPRLIVVFEETNGGEGPTGPMGATGVTGPTGPTGPTGAAGTTGASGASRSDGRAGSTGAPGRPEAQARPGRQGRGPYGADGADRDRGRRRAWGDRRHGPDRRDGDGADGGYGSDGGDRDRGRRRDRGDRRHWPDRGDRHSGCNGAERRGGADRRQGIQA